MSTFKKFLSRRSIDISQFKKDPTVTNLIRSKINDYIELYGHNITVLNIADELKVGVNYLDDFNTEKLINITQ